MQNTYKWEITPTTWPMAIRNCPKCGNSVFYECSGNFRVNANHSALDVWLIYQCNNCNNTWNMEILSRTNVKSIDKELYQKFLSNDKELAQFYAFDSATLSRNRTNINYEQIGYTVTGDIVPYNELNSACEVDIHCVFPFELRLDRLLVNQLGLSREQIKRLSETGKIITSVGKHITKTKIKNDIRLILYP